MLYHNWCCYHLLWIYEIWIVMWIIYEKCQINFVCEIYLHNACENISTRAKFMSSLIISTKFYINSKINIINWRFEFITILISTFFLFVLIFLFVVCWTNLTSRSIMTKNMMKKFDDRDEKMQMLITWWNKVLTIEFKKMNRFEFIAKNEMNCLNYRWNWNSKMNKNEKIEMFWKWICNLNEFEFEYATIKMLYIEKLHENNQWNQKRLKQTSISMFEKSWKSNVKKQMKHLIENKIVTMKFEILRVFVTNMKKILSTKSTRWLIVSCWIDDWW